MECFKVSFNDIEGRLDSHFYKPEFKALSEGLQKLNYKSLGEIIYFANETWNQKDFFDAEFPYIEISEIDVISGEIKNITYYNKKDAPSRARMIVRENDIIVSTTRPNRGAIALTDKAKDGFIASTGFTILRNLQTKEVDRNYLFHTLRTNLSLKQMLQRSSGGNYPAITTDELKKIIIPLPSPAIQQQVVEIMQSAYKQKQQKEQEAEKLLSSIDDYVLNGLGISLPEVKDKKCFVVYVNEIDGRFNPYYNSSKLKEIIKLSPNKEGIKLVEFREVINSITKGETPLWRGDSYLSEGIPFLKVQNISQEGIKGELAHVSAEVHRRMKRSQLKGGELLYTMAGTIGVVTILPEDFGDANINQAIAKVILKENVNKEYINIVLNSYYCRIQAQKFLTTSAQPNVNFEQIKSIKIPLPSLETQNKIAEEVQRRMSEAEKLKIEANNLVDKAKQQVEDLIISK